MVHGTVRESEASEPIARIGWHGGLTLAGLRPWWILIPLLLTAHLADSAERPNILVILADDLGYSDLGCYGSEIDTPVLDRLAADGLRFTQFYNTGRCWPTRAALLTGYYAQQVRRDAVPGIPSGGGGQRPNWAKLLPELLRPAGYRSYHSGKWHVDGARLAGGFDRSLSIEDHDHYFHPRRVLRDDQVAATGDEPSTGSDEDGYVTCTIADHAIACLRAHAAEHGEQPFFHYVCFTAPHFPLQAPAAEIAGLNGHYQDGWEAVRGARWQRIQSLGIVAGSLADVERDLGPPYDFPDALRRLGPGELNRPRDWQTLTEEQRAFQTQKMQIHAAMIQVMDRQIGRIIDQVQAMPGHDNTLILFLSDNGASAEIMVRGDGHDPAAPLGSPATFLCLGPGWSTVANTPFRRHKTWVHEGGIATPLIVHWPAGIADRGGLRHAPGHVIDLVPTFLELAGLPATASSAGPQRPGWSLLRHFSADVADEERTLWWLHEGNRALRQGSWKLVAGRGEPWQLFDLAHDRTETRDLAESHADQAARLADVWERMTAEHFATAAE